MLLTEGFFNHNYKKGLDIRAGWPSLFEMRSELRSR